MWLSSRVIAAAAARPASRITTPAVNRLMHVQRAAAAPAAGQVADSSHSQTEDDMAELRQPAGLLARLGHEQARKLYEQALGAKKAAVGDRNENVATILTGLGFLAQNAQTHERSLELYKEALQIYRTSLGDKHVRMRARVCAS